MVKVIRSSWKWCVRKFLVLHIWKSICMEYDYNNNNNDNISKSGNSSYGWIVRRLAHIYWLNECSLDVKWTHTQKRSNSNSNRAKRLSINNKSSTSLSMIKTLSDVSMSIRLTCCDLFIGVNLFDTHFDWRYVPFCLFLFHFFFYSLGACRMFPLRCVAVRPVCRHDQKRIYGVARNEMAKILCEVDAYPAPTNFKWSFNNTAETIDMPQNGFEKHSRTSSRLSYTPVKVCV